MLWSFDYRSNQLPQIFPCQLLLQFETNPLTDLCEMHDRNGQQRLAHWIVQLLQTAALTYSSQGPLFINRNLPSQVEKPWGSGHDSTWGFVQLPVSLLHEVIMWNNQYASKGCCLHPAAQLWTPQHLLSYRTSRVNYKALFKIFLHKVLRSLKS